MSNFLVVRQGDTERWTLNDPATRNALSDGMVVALFGACLRAKADASLRTVVLTGGGGAFCAGGSLGHFASAIGQPLAEGAHDPLIDANRAFGDVLHALTELPQLLVVAVDNPDAALRIVQLARRHFPDLKLIVRARSRTDAFEYALMGVTQIRETFGSALSAAEDALRELGHGRLSARRAINRFRKHDEEGLKEQAHHRHDEGRLITLSQQGRADLERLLSSEAARRSATS